MQLVVYLIVSVDPIENFVNNLERGGKMQRVTEVEAREWKRLYEERGLSIPAIARKAGRNHHVVYYTLLKYGTEIRSGQVGEQVSPAEVNGWMQAFLIGQSPEQFEACTRTAQTIYKHLAIRLKEHYLEIKGRGVK